LTERGRLRERQLWIAVTAVLATALAWLAAVNFVLLLNVYAGRFPEVFVVMRALAKAAQLLGRAGGPAILAALAVAGLLIALALRTMTRTERRTRHA